MWVWLVYKLYYVIVWRNQDLFLLIASEFKWAISNPNQHSRLQQKSVK